MKLRSQLFLLLILSVATCGVLFLTLLRLGFFEVNRIEITGTERVSDREVLKRSGLRLGKNMLFFEEALRGEILKSPWIADADIKREFLLRKVIIEIEEYEPFCLLRGQDNEFYYVSGTGKKLGGVNFDDGLDFPVLIGEGIEDLGLVEGSLKILKLSLESDVLNWKEISEINLDPIYGITVFTTDGRQIDFGEDGLQGKWHKVEKIITHTRKINLTEKYINISSGKMGVVNFQL